MTALEGHRGPIVPSGICSPVEGSDPCFNALVQRPKKDDLRPRTSRVSIEDRGYKDYPHLVLAVTFHSEVFLPLFTPFVASLTLPRAGDTGTSSPRATGEGGKRPPPRLPLPQRRYLPRSRVWGGPEEGARAGFLSWIRFSSGIATTVPGVGAGEEARGRVGWGMLAY
jgi:hypothetical protein